jgi:hypothetical protein
MRTSDRKMLLGHRKGFHCDLCAKRREPLANDALPCLVEGKGKQPSRWIEAQLWALGSFGHMVPRDASALCMPRAAWCEIPARSIRDGHIHMRRRMQAKTNKQTNKYKKICVDRELAGVTLALWRYACINNQTLDQPRIPTAGLARLVVSLPREHALRSLRARAPAVL